ncbi:MULTISPECIES: DNA topoisomerase III [unclassified Peribacillus]|uniref:DNA topoisomerase III n=1 Tax=unclassified Peribacillus TaxID=2675266 RepID=UPI001912B513|nr:MULTISPECIES: DNA topoisomerase III [unclassified Peribacillus]MBK5442179.1 DNA topoisomerase III [Peribacillus sp. TH24]MBK5463046.1 DNA topoisomerase III [Peribacillus sp. TH27]WMX53775.1 DNA topoisomerase III [Peribacillus sp. R9-11]
MKLIIAEKPDQGSTLAGQFKTKKQQGYIEILPNELFPDGAYVTWAVGHLCQLVSPETYHSKWKKWSIDTLPMIPEKFQYEVTRQKAKQFNVVKTLLRKSDVDEIIHAGDAGREGELIVRNIVNLCSVKKPMKRLWISSLTPKAIYEGFQNLISEEKTRPLYYEAYTRACADWVVGMNASRAYSILLKQRGVSDVFSAGRVQTPTLALIVKREMEIEQFKSEPFWEVFADFKMDGNKYQGKWQQKNDPRIKTKELAEKIAAFCKGKEAEIAEMDTERKEFQPPLLFNLSSLQATVNKIYKYSPKMTLDIVQSLYQKGIVSYPRSDSNYVTEGEAETFPDILQKISRFSEYESLFPLPQSSIINNKRFVNEKKVTDHYAIIPTEQVTDPKRLSAEERNIYDLVVRRLIAAHYEKAIFDYTTIKTLVDKRAEFISKGKQQIQEGWRKVIFQNDKDDDDIILPPVKKGDSGQVASVKVKEGKTQPPKRYTEGQLITLMKTAGKHLDNEELEKVLMKAEGLGTEATRAGIITMLKDRKYIDVKKNQVFATDKGKVLITAIGEKILASPEMTAKWEQRLREIGEGKASAGEFMEAVKKMSAKIISDAVESSENWDFQGLDTESIQRSGSKKRNTASVGSCKLCGSKIVDKGEFYGCVSYQKTKCNFTISKKILNKKISQANIKKLLASGETDLISGFKKGEKTFDAILSWSDSEKKISFTFPTEQAVKQT